MPEARSLRSRKISIVAPCYNEEESLRAFVQRVRAVVERLPCSFEILLVNDGSSDRTLAVALEIATADPHVRVINLLRNFGHQAAATAGLDLASGDVVVLIDADLQDPPEVIPEMISRWEAGADVAYGQRHTRPGESALKLVSAKLFYRLLRHLTTSSIPADTGDFRLMDRKIVDALRQMRERHRFIRGMVSWVGGRQVAVLYDRSPRFGGKTKYPLRKMVSFALDAITSFSVVPLRWVTYLALGIIVLAVGATVTVFVVKLTRPDYFIPGFAATMITIIFFGGVQLLALGVIGEYLGRMYESVKSRPIYLIDGVYGGDPLASPPAAPPEPGPVRAPGAEPTP
jgi:dolichol-phosphate mannosyltransferase